MGEYRKLAERYLWLAGLVVGGMMLVSGASGSRYEPQLKSVALILDGTVLVATSLVCVYLGRKEDGKDDKPAS